MSVLKGQALIAVARELNIPGRSRMTADELRAAIDAVSGQIPEEVGQRISFLTLSGPTVPVAESPSAQESADTWEPFPEGPGRVTRSFIFMPVQAQVPFRARNGKRKPSIHRKNRH